MYALHILLLYLPLSFSGFAATILTCIAFRIPMRKIQLGSGPKLFSIGIVEVKVFPLSASIDFNGQGEDEVFTGDEFPLVALVVVCFSAMIAWAPLACFAYKGDHLAEFLRTYPELIKMIFHPLTFAQDWFASLEAQIRRDYLSALGYLSIKLLAVQLIPLSTFPPMNALRYVKRRMSKGESTEKWFRDCLLLIPTLLLFLLVIFAYVVYVVRRVI